MFRSFGNFLLFSLGITNLSNLVLHDILQSCIFYFFFSAAFHIPFSNSVIFIYKPHLYFQIRYSVLMTYWFQISNLLFCLYPFSWVYLSLFSLSRFNTFLVAGTWMFYIIWTYLNNPVKARFMLECDKTKSKFVASSRHSSNDPGCVYKGVFPPFWIYKRKLTQGVKWVSPCRFYMRKTLRTSFSSTR